MIVTTMISPWRTRTMINQTTSGRAAAPEIYYISTTLEVWRRPDYQGASFEARGNCLIL